MADTFEMTFSKLATAVLRDKAPMLVDKMIGFQIIDKNDEGTKAIGIAAFIVNDVVLYVPVFFRNGKIDGTDLLYVKQNDAFVPNRDSWISSFEKSGPTVLGEGVDYADTFFKAVRPQPPGSVRVSGSIPIVKSAADNADESKVVVEKMAAVSPTKNGYDFLMPVLRLNKTAAEKFLGSVLNDPDFGNMFFQFYNGEDLRSLAEVASHSTMQKSALEEEVSKVDIVTSADLDKVKDMPTSEKKQMVRNGMFVRDSRSTFSKIYDNRIKSGVVENPTETGVYDVLLSDGTFRTMLVITSGIELRERGDCACPRSNMSSTRQVLDIQLVDPDNPKVFFTVPRNQVFVREPSIDGLSSFKKAIGGVEATVTSIGALGVRDKDGKFSSPGGKYMQILVMNGLGPAFIISGRPQPAQGNVVQFFSDPDVSLEFADKTGKLCRVGNRVIVPEGSRFFRAANWEDPKPRLGNLDVIWAGIIKQASLESLTVTADGPSYQIMFGGQPVGSGLDKKAAVETLTKTFGIFGGQAMQICNDASREKRTGYMIKLAAPYYINDYAGKPPMIMNGPFPVTQEAVKETVTSFTGKQAPQFPKDMLEKAVKAGEKGVKEVFEASILKNLLEVGDIAEIGKDDIVDMVRGLDRVGRTLYRFYANRDFFEEKYGNSDAKKLESTLKTVFVDLGDLILFLKEKIGSQDSADNLFGSLSGQMVNDLSE